jgi:GTP-binding protein
MFVDKARIFIKAGDGGGGHVSFRHEKYVNNGGPDGGDGGDGGSIVFEADENMRTLMDFNYQRRFVAPNGEPGGPKNMKGRAGDDLIIKVPPGTVIKDEETGRVAADLREGSRELLHGGAGGKGNARFATPTRQAPTFATPGRRTKGRFVLLELKTIADVGLIGYPSVGKSTLLAASTGARPKIADYHFTTLSPNLGVARVHEDTFVMADIPGLIEGAHEGAGLGTEFLRHVERTRMLIHVVDASQSEGRDVIADYEIIRRELAGYSPLLAQRPEIVAANKMDVPGAETHAEKLKAYLSKRGIEMFEICAAAGLGLQPLMERAAEMLRSLPIPKTVVEDGVIEEWALEKDETDFTVARQDGVFYVEGPLIKDIMAKTNPDDASSMRHFQKLLVDFGVIKALKKERRKDGRYRES